MLGAPVLTVVSSDVEPFRKGIFQTSNVKAQTSYTTLETGAGKSSILTANIIIGNDVDTLNPPPRNRVESVRKYEMSKSKATYVSPSDCTRRAC